MNMDCRTFIDRLDDLLEGRLTAGERREAEEHLRDCHRCGDLVTVIRENPNDQRIEAPADLTEAILNRTSGPTCASARGRLCDHVDRSLEPADDELVRLHLRGCDECTGLSHALAGLTADLPALAELEPDSRFVDDVLARTRPLRSPIIGWVERMAEEWRRLAQRPRIAWEGAYVAMFFLVLIFGIPDSPLAGVPQRALALVRTDPVASLRKPAGEIAPQVTAAVQSAWRTTHGRVKGASRKLVADVTRRSSDLAQSSSTAFEAIRWKLGTVLDRLASEQETNDTNRSVEDAGQTDGEEP
jgi:predicted anti-sigma-YlaC factor YlaD